MASTNAWTPTTERQIKHHLRSATAPRGSSTAAVQLNSARCASKQMKRRRANKISNSTRAHAATGSLWPGNALGRVGAQISNSQTAARSACAFSNILCSPDLDRQGGRQPPGRSPNNIKRDSIRYDATNMKQRRQATEHPTPPATAFPRRPQIRQRCSRALSRDSAPFNKLSERRRSARCGWMLYRWQQRRAAR